MMLPKAFFALKDPSKSQKFRRAEQKFMSRSRANILFERGDKAPRLVKTR